MATGYDTRQGGRDSFASQAPGPIQLGRGTASGESRGAQVVGGDAVAGGAPNVQITNPGSGAADMGRFFGDLMKPYVERKQQQQFFNGFVRAQSGEALGELAKSSKGVMGQLFGPNSLAQGAEFYTGMKKVDDWHASMVTRMDELKQLTPDELSKELAKTSLAMMGDDPYVNQLVQKQLIDKTGPLVDTVAKNRYIWQQDTARQTMHDALDSAGGSFQAAAVAAAKVSDPSDPTVAAGQASLHSFLNMMAKPEGMSDDTYEKTLSASMVSFAQNGNFYAFNALKSHGVMDVLTDDQQKKVTDSYDRYMSKSFEQAKGNHVQDLLDVKLKVSKRQMSPLEAVAAVDKINADITAETGITERAYDSSYLQQTGGDVIGMLASDAAKDEERKYQEGREIAREEREEARKLREDAQNFGAASTALQLGHPTDYMMKGGKADALDKAWISAYSGGNLQPIVSSFQNEGTTNGNIARMMQSDIVAGGGVTFTGQVKKGYQTWASMMRADPGAAAAYFGGQHPRLLYMQQMIDSGAAPEAAYQSAFADTNKARFTGATLRPQDRKETLAALTAAVNGTNSYRLLAWAGFQPRRMGDDAKRLLLNVASESAANLQRNSNMDPTSIAQQAIGTVRGNNQFEGYGGNMAWSNKTGTKKAHELIGVPEMKFGDILHGAIDDHLKAIGAGNADGNYQIDRVPVNGGFVLMVKPDDPAHSGTPVLITSAELKHRATEDARQEVAGNRPKTTHYNGVNAFRTVKGESGWARMSRIQREVAAGADPVQHLP